jgi:sulfur-carrier protein adenylyltransferase/sulfurtransferase
MENGRYHRQTILSGFGATEQAKLSQAKVLVVGAGGLGCPVLQYLAASGIGHLGIIDGDYIELSNLHRQILYQTSEIGKQKSVVAAKRLSELNSEIKIVNYPLDIDRQNVLEIIAHYDFIIDGSDNFKTRYLVNDASAKLKKPLIFAAVSGYEGQLAIFNVPDENQIATNYRDLFPIPPSMGEIPNCEGNGVLGVLPGIIGTMAAAECIKLITGIGKSLVNTLLHYNLLTNEQYAIEIVPGTGYTFDDLTTTQPELIEIGANELGHLREKLSTLIIDVREMNEVPKLDSNLYQQVPMSSFEAYLKTDIHQKNIVFICQHGIRSVAAAEKMLAKYGNTKNIYSLKGGIVKWHNYFITVND